MNDVLLAASVFFYIFLGFLGINRMGIVIRNRFDNAEYRKVEDRNRNVYNDIN